MSYPESAKKITVTYGHFKKNKKNNNHFINIAHCIFYIR